MYHCTFLDLQDKQTREKLQKIIRDASADTIVAVGGDGTVTFVAGLLLGTGVKLGIIPTGSANGMARELGIPTEPEKAMQLIAESSAKAVDVIAIREHGICLHLSDIGLNAQLVKYFQEGVMRGNLGYFRALLRAMVRSRKLSVKVQSREETASRNAVMVIIANATKYGTGAVINPEGSIHDGWFEVVIVKKLGFVSLLKMFVRFAKFNPKNIEVIPARKVLISSRRAVHFQVDGEYLGKVKEVEAEIIPGKLQILMPLD